MVDDDYDIAGFAVGVVDKKNIITGEHIIPGDIVIGLPSSGIHSNGYSLVRKLFFDMKKYSVQTQIAELGTSLGSALLVPTRIYCKSVLACLEKGIALKGLVHITGGGFYENIPRILPAQTAVRISISSYELPPIFRMIQREGAIDDREMYTTFNMGIGMMVFVDKHDVTKTRETLTANGEHPIVIGEVIENNGVRVILA
jgi:phosphoribosylformylglycinamidine cyclo-ligase